MSTNCFRCGAERTPHNPVNVAVETDDGPRMVCDNFAACERRESDALAETFDESPLGFGLSATVCRVCGDDIPAGDTSRQGFDLCAKRDCVEFDPCEHCNGCERCADSEFGRHADRAEVA